MAAAPQQPKKPAGGGFGQFVAEKRASFAKQCEGKPVSAVSKLAGEAWKALSDAEKVPYNKKFQEAQKKYVADMEAFLAAGGVKTKGATALRSEKRKAKEGTLKKQKDPSAPKKPAGGGYGCFMAANRESFQKECPGSITGVAKLAGVRWKALPEAEKEKHNKEFETKMAAYKEAMKSYVPPAVAEEDDAVVEPPAKKSKLEEKKAEKEEKKAASAAKQEEKKAAASANKEAKSAKGKVIARGKAKAKAKEPETPVDIPKTVLAKAEKASMVEVLTKLLRRGDIQDAGIAAGKALSALEEAGGLLHPARRALLGA